MKQVFSEIILIVLNSFTGVFSPKMLESLNAI